MLVARYYYCTKCSRPHYEDLELEVFRDHKFWMSDLGLLEDIFPTEDSKTFFLAVLKRSQSLERG